MSLGPIRQEPFDNPGYWAYLQEEFDPGTIDLDDPVLRGVLGDPFVQSILRLARERVPVSPINIRAEAAEQVRDLLLSQELLDRNDTMTPGRLVLKAEHIVTSESG